MWSTNSCKLVLSLAYILFTTSRSQRIIDPNTPGVLNPNFFLLGEQEEGAVQCELAGSKCAFFSRQLDFTIPLGRGQTISTILNNEIWSALDTNIDFITFRGCKPDQSCLVVCSEFCNCALTDGSPCTVVETRPPTPAPTTIQPTVFVPPKCPRLERGDDTGELCNELVSTGVPLGVNVGDGCCMSFCNGLFLGCCFEDGRCASFVDQPELQSTCTNFTVGVREGIVHGCTLDDIDGTVPPAAAPVFTLNRNTQSPTPSGVLSHWRSPIRIALAAAAGLSFLVL